MARWPAKASTERRDHKIDWSDFLGDADEIASSEIVATGVTVESDAVDEDRKGVTIWLSGGTSGTVAKIVNVITTDDGRTESQTVTLEINDFAEPVSLEEAKTQLGLLDDDSRDTLILQKIRTAREMVEEYTGHVLVRRQITEHRRCFSSFFELHHQPIVPGTMTINYTDTTGGQSSYETFFVTSGRPARVYPNHDAWWPTLGRNGEVTLSYMAGYAEGEVPQRAIESILVLISGMFSEREGAYELSVKTAYANVDGMRGVGI